MTAGKPASISEPAVSTEGAAQPRQTLGLRDLVMFYIVATLSLRWIPYAASAGPGSLVIWVIGLLTIFIPLALCVMELSSRYPQEGGMYVWSKHAFGDFAGFMTGWIYWTSNLPYFPVLLYFAAANALYIGGDRWKAAQGNAVFFVTFSLLGLGLALAMNIVGLDIGKWLSNLGAIGTWLPLGLLWVIAAVVWLKFGSATQFTHAMKPSMTLGDAGVWGTLLFAFGGAEAASFMGGEIKNARRTVPRALFIAGVIITFGYMISTVAILVSIPAAQTGRLEGLMQAISLSATRLGWYGLGPAMALLICLANLGGVNAYLAALSRVPFVAGIDHFLPSAFGRLHRRWGTPHIALIVQALSCAVFILLSQAGSSVGGAYKVLISMTIIGSFIPFLFMFAALIRLQREPVAPGVTRIPGGRPAAVALAILGFISTTIVIVASVLPDPGEPHKLLAMGKLFVLTAMLVGGGVLIYAIGTRHARSR